MSYPQDVVCDSDESWDSRAKMQETRAELAQLPEPEKVVTFDAVERVVSSLRVAIDAATPEQLRDLMRMVIARVTVTETDDYEIEPVPAARPFFAPQKPLSLAPPDGLERPIPTQRSGRVSRRWVSGLPYFTSRGTGPSSRLRPVAPDTPSPMPVIPVTKVPSVVSWRSLDTGQPRFVRRIATCSNYM